MFIQVESFIGSIFFFVYYENKYLDNEKKYFCSLAYQLFATSMLLFLRGNITEQLHSVLKILLKL